MRRCGLGWCARRTARAVACALGLCLAAPGVLRAQDEVPFVVTPDSVTLAMLQLARVGPRDFVLDLGDWRPEGSLHVAAPAVSRLLSTASGYASHPAPARRRR